MGRKCFDIYIYIYISQCQSTIKNKVIGTLCLCAVGMIYLQNTSKIKTKLNNSFAVQMF